MKKKKKMEINKIMTYIPNSENLQSKVERYEQRPVKASAFLCLGAERTAEKTIIKGSRFAACIRYSPNGDTPYIFLYYGK